LQRSGNPAKTPSPGGFRFPPNASGFSSLLPFSVLSVVESKPDDRPSLGGIRERFASPGVRQESEGE
jgi:hypothetical protein